MHGNPSLTWSDESQHMACIYEAVLRVNVYIFSEVSSFGMNGVENEINVSKTIMLDRLVAC